MSNKNKNKSVAFNREESDKVIFNDNDRENFKDFEKDLFALEEIVNSLDKKSTNLNESIAKYKNGKKLINKLSKELKSVDKEITKIIEFQEDTLSKKVNLERTNPFEDDELISKNLKEDK